MSKTAELLRRLSEIGADIQPAGDKLIVRAGARPVPAELVMWLRADKAEVLAVLAPSSEARDAAWWRGEFTIRTLDCELGSRTSDEAERLAFNQLAIEWHRRYGKRIPIWQCAGCGEPIGGFPSLDFNDDNRVHFRTLDCLIRYGERWRGEATRALVAMGLRRLPRRVSHEQ